MISNRRFRLLLLAGIAISFAPFAKAAEPVAGANVYLLRMSSRFDSYLANQLTQQGALTVVTDAKLAQYVLTDSVGSDFEAAMDRLYRQPEPAETDAGQAGESEKESGTISMVEAYSSVAPRVSSFSRTQGNIYLVNRESSVVVWSTFLDLRDTRSERLNKSAGEVVKRLQKHIKENTEVAITAQ